jgi:hypothetical protein
MCRSGVASIFVMFDVLNCYILDMCLLLFVYCIFYPILEAPCRGDRQNREQILMFIVFPDEHKGHVEVDVADRVYHVTVIFIGEPMNIRSTWRTFIGQVEPMNVMVLGLSVPPGRRT